MAKKTSAAADLIAKLKASMPPPEAVEDFDYFVKAGVTGEVDYKAVGYADVTKHLMKLGYPGTACTIRRQLQQAIEHGKSKG